MTRLDSFGRVFPAASEALAATDGMALLRRGDARAGMLLAYGNGRSYGDTCLNAAGRLVDMRGLDRILEFDAEDGVITAEAGVLLGDMIARAAPHGFFPPVVPGTQFVTLGGAIANDVHGKNHHRRGTFGCHVVSLDLLRSDGRTYRCSLEENRELFAATIGGMGLTGLILSASLRLMPVRSPDVMQEARPFANLRDYFSLAEQADAENEYAVAWIDQLASGSGAGRGVLLTGNHAADGNRRYPVGGGRLAVPFQPPVNVLNRPFLTLFNAAYRLDALRRKGSHRVSASGFFFPLDGVRHWNRLYGPKGLYQHQSVIPADAAPAVIPELLAATRESGQASFLTVLKRFGDVPSPGVLSFPRPGYTLTLDFPNRGAATRRLLDELDRLTVSAGGAVNPYKDARMPPDVFASSFPHWRHLERYRDAAFLSDFWRRTVMRLDGQSSALAAE